ncbi:hypothetical protein FHL15_000805 [Xylaria flabelliformis]|uniref:F-box domain-containing protein n=1 Tax=Xylaria flabelliformis TaxID=2512241 RepID=A0A553ID83_9PEZI|nr:hypothetical protein FHL15_000805 [Xylaria flabelliformis]
MAQLTTPVSDPSADNENIISDLTDLPHDIFLLIISYLSPAESILCRRVSQSWKATFTSYDVSWSLMKWHFSRAREMRNAVAAPDWAHIFPKVARRYFHLRSAKPSRIQKIDIAPKEREDLLLFLAVEPWFRWLRWNDAVGTFQHRDLSWCLEDSLLIYRESTERYAAYDLETGLRFSVPFDGTDKIVRRLRLAQGTLVIEWCEQLPFIYSFDLGTSIHWHFATAFDIRRLTDSKGFAMTGSWEIRFRCEWKLHRSGLSIDRNTRFFSAHTSTHYALYIWHYNGLHEAPPREELTIWEIGDTPSHCSPEGPAGVKIHDTAQSQPRVIKTFMERELAFLGIRQYQTPALREIFLDEANVYTHEEGHPWLTGPHSPRVLRRHHHVRSTGFPFLGVGPRWFDQCCANGTINLNFCPRVGSAARRSSSKQGSALDYFERKWAGWAPCWRHEEFPYLTISHVVDEGAGVRIAARQCLVVETLSSFVFPKISLRAEPDEAHEVHFADDMWKQLLGKGKIMGDERWVVGEDGSGSITIVYF